MADPQTSLSKPLPPRIAHWIDASSAAAAGGVLFADIAATLGLEEAWKGKAYALEAVGSNTLQVRFGTGTALVTTPNTDGAPLPVGRRDPVFIDRSVEDDFRVSWAGGAAGSYLVIYQYGP